MQRARPTLERITDEVNNPRFPFLSDILVDKIVPNLKTRIDLARIDENVFNGYGSLGAINNFGEFNIQHQFSDLNLQNALSSLTGRLFQVECINGAIDVNQSSILSTSSGTLISWDPINSQINNLPSLVNAPLNSVLTCARWKWKKTDQGELKSISFPQMHLI